MPSRSDNAPPPSIADYELIEKVGEGGMAEVWLARRPGIGGAVKSCALKLPLPHMAGDDRFRRMFLSEARLALKLSHANIVSVFDAGEAEGRLYMALEWIDGVDLRSFAQRIHQLPMRFSIAVVCHVVGELLHALRYAHTFAIGGQSLGIIHRDVSPQNVLISSSGEVKLSDFGIARVFGEETSQMHVKGKLRYMAPEQFRGKPEQASDLFAVGTILHELLEGRRFRDGLESREDWMHALMTDVQPSLDRVDVPPEVRALHDGLLQPDPQHRIRTADDALMRLGQCPQWRNSTTELRKMYARYFNQNRRTGLTQGDGMLPALPDAATSGPLAGLEEAPASLPTVPQPPAQAEPDAPMFFRKGPRRGRPSSAPAAKADARTTPYGETPEPAPDTPGSQPTLAAASGPQVDAIDRAAMGSGPVRHEGPEAFAATVPGQSGEAKGEATSPDARERTRPTAGPDDVTNTSLATRIQRSERKRRRAMLATGGVAVVLAGVGTVAALEYGRDDEPATTPAAAGGAASADGAGHSSAAASSSARAAGDDPASGPDTPRAHGGDAASSPGTPRANGGAASGPDTPRVGAEPAGQPAAATAPDDAASTVLVQLRLDTVPQAWVRIGSDEFFVDDRADAKLPPGEHALSWKLAEGAPWTNAEPLTLSANKELLVTISSKGLAVAAYDR